MRCVPFDAVTGEAPHWHASGPDPRFEIILDQPLASGWLALAWESALSDPASRPVLTFLYLLPDGSENKAEFLLNAAIFGRQSAIIPVPAGVNRILISPTDQPGPFGFRLCRAEQISAASAFLLGLRTQPLNTLHALGAALIGRQADFRLLLTEAIHAQPISRYGHWKAARQRQPEWDGLDCFIPDGLPRLHCIHVGSANETKARSRTAAAALVNDIHAGDCVGGDTTGDRARLLALLAGLPPTDLVILQVPGVELVEDAVPALLRLAGRNPQADLFFGDEELVASDGSFVPAFSPGFDPLWTFPALKSSLAWCVRIGLLRYWLAEGAPVSRIMAAPLYRPLASREQPLTPPGLLQALLGDLQAGWEKTWPAPAVHEPIDAAIIIPTRDRLPLLQACIESIEPELPPTVEIIVIDNGSVETETLEFLKAFSGKPHRKVLRVEGPFNFSRLCNLGARASTARMLVFLNNDTTASSPAWLEALWRHAVRPDEGAIGARLYYPGGKVQHAGVIVGLGGYAGHVDLHADPVAQGCFGRLLSDHSLLAVTGACLAVERAKFEAVGGFDEENLPVDLNDIDLCLRLGERGWRTVLVAGAELVHHESASRGRTASKPRYLKEKAHFAARWRAARRGDPHYHPALSLLLTRPSLG